MKKPKYRIVIFRSPDHKWYWHVRHKNGNIVADGSEGYERRATLIKSLKHLLKFIETSGLEIAEGK